MAFSRKTLRDICQRIVGKHYMIDANFKDQIAWNDEHTTSDLYHVRIWTEESKEKNGVTLYMLDQLSGAFRTRNINLGHEQGWTGSDLTPADPCSFEIYIRDIGSI